MVTFYIFMLVVAAVGVAAYLGLFFSHVPGAADERLGKLDPLPEKLGQWVEDEKRSEEGFLCERRYLVDESNALKVIVQVRYRDPATHEIVRVDPESSYKRKRRL